MGTLRWPHRTGHRYEDFWGFSAAQGVAEEVRVRTGPGGCGCKETIGQVIGIMKGVSMATVMRADFTKPSISAETLSGEEVRQMNAYWRAANYLSVGQIYLYANALLREPLKIEHVKPRLLGHW